MPPPSSPDALFSCAVLLRTLMEALYRYLVAQTSTCCELWAQASGLTAKLPVKSGVEGRIFGAWAWSRQSGIAVDDDDDVGAG